MRAIVYGLKSHKLQTFGLNQLFIVMITNYLFIETSQRQTQNIVSAPLSCFPKLCDFSILGLESVCMRSSVTSSSRSTTRWRTSAAPAAAWPWIPGKASRRARGTLCSAGIPSRGWPALLEDKPSNRDDQSSNWRSLFFSNYPFFYDGHQNWLFFFFTL